MKLRKLYEQVLNERKNVGIVYHFTKLHSAFRIIDSGIMKAEVSTNNFKFPTISTTRDKNFINHRVGNKSMTIGGTHVGFKLSGDKLSDKYEVRPYDDTVRTGGNVIGTAREDYGDEMEELWFGNRLEADGGFKPIGKYIESIILTKALKDDLMQNSDKLKMSESWIEGISEFGNPIKKFNSIKAWFESKGFKVEI